MTKMGNSHRSHIRFSCESMFTRASQIFGAVVPNMNTNTMTPPTLTQGDAGEPKSPRLRRCFRVLIS